MSSRYWVEGDRLVRESNHWAGVECDTISGHLWQTVGEPGTWRTGWATITDVTQEGCQHWFVEYCGLTGTPDGAALRCGALKALTWLWPRRGTDWWEAAHRLYDKGIDVQPEPGIGMYMMLVGWSDNPGWLGLTVYDVEGGCVVNVRTGEVTAGGRRLRRSASGDWAHPLWHTVSPAGRTRRLTPDKAAVVDRCYARARRVRADWMRDHALVWREENGSPVD